MTTIFIVKADNHDYDFMSEWYSDFAFSDRSEAEAEVDRLKKEYWKANPGSKRRGLPNVEILEFELKGI